MRFEVCSRTHVNLLSSLNNPERLLHLQGDLNVAGAVSGTFAPGMPRTSLGIEIGKNVKMLLERRQLYEFT